MKSERGETEKDKLINNGKKMGIDEIVKELMGIYKKYINFFLYIYIKGTKWTKQNSICTKYLRATDNIDIINEADYHYLVNNIQKN